MYCGRRDERLNRLVTDAVIRVCQTYTGHTELQLRVRGLLVLTVNENDVIVIDVINEKPYGDVTSPETTRKPPPAHTHALVSPPTSNSSGRSSPIRDVHEVAQVLSEMQQGVRLQSTVGNNNLQVNQTSSPDCIVSPPCQDRNGTQELSPETHKYITSVRDINDNISNESSLFEGFPKVLSAKTSAVTGVASRTGNGLPFNESSSSKTVSNCHSSSPVASVVLPKQHQTSPPHAHTTPKFLQGLNLTCKKETLHAADVDNHKTSPISFSSDLLRPPLQPRHSLFLESPVSLSLKDKPHTDSSCTRDPLGSDELPLNLKSTKSDQAISNKIKEPVHRIDCSDKDSELPLNLKRPLPSVTSGEECGQNDPTSNSQLPASTPQVDSVTNSSGVDSGGWGSSSDECGRSSEGGHAAILGEDAADDDLPSTGPAPRKRPRKQEKTKIKWDVGHGVGTASHPPRSTDDILMAVQLVKLCQLRPPISSTAQQTSATPAASTTQFIPNSSTQELESDKSSGLITSAEEIPGLKTEPAQDDAGDISSHGQPSEENIDLKTQDEIVAAEAMSNDVGSVSSKNGELSQVKLAISETDEPDMNNTDGDPVSGLSDEEAGEDQMTAEPGQPRKLYSCSCCDKTFSSLWKMKHHLPSHSEEDLLRSYEPQTIVDPFSGRPRKVFPCTVCDKTFASMWKLKRHLSSHTGKKQYKCDLCGKDFVESALLKRHLRIHSGEKPYRCAICCQVFTDSGNLRKHAKIHSGTHTYECYMCGEGFHLIDDMFTHMGTHTGTRPFQCSGCQRTFTQPGHLSIHRTHCKDFRPELIPADD